MCERSCVCAHRRKNSFWHAGTHSLVIHLVCVRGSCMHAYVHACMPSFRGTNVFLDDGGAGSGMKSMNLMPFFSLCIAAILYQDPFGRHLLMILVAGREKGLCKLRHGRSRSCAALCMEERLEQYLNSYIPGA